MIYNVIFLGDGDYFFLKRNTYLVWKFEFIISHFFGEVKNFELRLQFINLYANAVQMRPSNHYINES